MSTPENEPSAEPPRSAGPDGAPTHTVTLTATPTPSPWQRFSAAIGGVSAAVPCALMLVVVGVGTYNTIARYLEPYFDVRLSSNGLLELQWYLFAAIFLLGGAYTLAHNSHVRVDVVYDRLSPKVRRAINVTGTVVFLLPFCALVLWCSWEPVMQSWEVREQSPDPSGLPRYWIKTLVPIGFAMLAVQGIVSLVREFRRSTP